MKIFWEIEKIANFTTDKSINMQPEVKRVSLMSLLTNIMNTKLWQGRSSHNLNQPLIKPQQGHGGFTFYGETPSAVTESDKIFNRQQAIGEISDRPSSQQSNYCTEEDLSSFPVAIAHPGDRLFILHLKGSEPMQHYLMNVGLCPGKEIQVVSLTDSGSAIVSIGDRQLGLSAAQAHQIMVTKDKLMNHQPTKVGRTQANSSDFQNQKANLIKTICLGDLAQGCKGRVMGYNQITRGYKGKLLAMGLTPGTEFAITRYAPLGDPVEIRVRGFSLSLRKHEANALLVEEVG
jgi:ferrous iron transport protein A